MDYLEQRKWHRFLDNIGLDIQAELAGNPGARELIQQPAAAFAQMREARARDVAEDQRERIEHWQRVKSDPRLRDKAADFSGEGFEWNDGRDRTASEDVPDMKNAARIPYSLDGGTHFFPAVGGPQHEMPADLADTYVARLKRVRPPDAEAEIAIVQAQVDGIGDAKSAWVYTAFSWQRFLEPEYALGYWRLPSKDMPPDVDVWLDKISTSQPPAARLPKLSETNARIRRYVVVAALHGRVVDDDRRITAEIWSDDLWNMVVARLEDGPVHGLTETFIRSTWTAVQSELQTKPGDDEVTLPPLLPVYQECEDPDEDPDFRRQWNLPLLAHSVMLYAHAHNLSEQQARNLGSAFAGECAAAQESLARDIKTMNTLSKEDRLELFRQWQPICRDLREAVRESLRTRCVDWDTIVKLVERHLDVMRHVGLCASLHVQDVRERIANIKARMEAEHRAWAKGFAERLVNGAYGPEGRNRAPQKVIEMKANSACGDTDYVLEEGSDFWTVTFERRKLPAIRGREAFAYVAYILSNPRQWISAVSIRDSVHLQQQEMPDPPQDYGENEENQRGHKDAITRRDSENRADMEYLMACQERLSELRVEQDRARDNGDEASVDRCQKEIDHIMSEVRKLTGPKGRLAKFTNDVDRAYATIRKAVKRTHEKVGEHSPELAQHLKNCIHFDKPCVSYQPETGINWYWVKPGNQ